MEINSDKTLTHPEKTVEIYSWVKDKGSRFISCSENFAKIAGVESPMDLLGKTDFDLIWRDRAESYLKSDQTALRGNYYKDYRPHKTAIGTIKLLVTKSPLFDPQGKIIGTTGAAIDLTSKYYCKKLGYLDNRGRLHLGSTFNNLYLKKKEVAVLRYTLLGHNVKQISAHSHIPSEKVRDYIHSIKIKLGWKVKDNVVEKSTEIGLGYLREEEYAWIS